MEREKSCGAVIYKEVNNEIYILLLKHRKGHWSYSKGHVEDNEDESTTALREIKEETNLDVKLDTNFKTKITYRPKPNTIKDVIYFTATPITNYIKRQKEEIAQIEWYPINKAFDILTYQEDKNVLICLAEYLKNNN